MAQEDGLQPRLRKGRQAEERAPRPPRFDRGKRTWKGLYVRTPPADAQQVMVKASIIKPGTRGLRSLKASAQQHVRYLRRESLNLDGHPEVYTRAGRAQEMTNFVARTGGDPHQFRLIVSPAQGRDLDLTTFTRALMAQVEKDVGVPLDWVAVNHYDTAHPHTHIVLRGRDLDDNELGFKRDYLARGLAYRGQEIATAMLGPQRSLEQEQARGLAPERGLERGEDDGRAIGF